MNPPIISVVRTYTLVNVYNFLIDSIPTYISIIRFNKKM